MAHDSVVSVCDRFEYALQQYLVYAQNPLPASLDEEPWRYNIKSEKTRPVLKCTRTIREHSVRIEYPPALQTELIISLMSGLDIVSESQAELGSLLCSGISAKDGYYEELSIEDRMKWSQAVQNLLSALGILKRDLTLIFARSKLKDEDLPLVLQRRQSDTPPISDGPPSQHVPPGSGAGGILQGLADWIKALQAEVDNCRSTHQGACVTQRQPTGLDLEHFLNNPESFLNSIATLPFPGGGPFVLPISISCAATSIITNEGPTPPYELSESGRREYGDPDRHTSNWRECAVRSKEYAPSGPDRASIRSHGTATEQGIKRVPVPSPPSRRRAPSAEV